jgi:riboflavin kinase/FMN adenylyltransferase
MTPPMLTTIDERVALMGSFGLDGILVLPFDQALAQVDYRTFIEKYLLRPFDMSLLLLGYDCRFGRNREGSAETAAALSSRLGFEVAVVEPVRSDTEIVSSTKIRNALIEGDFAEAVRLLGHPYVLSGAVVRGHGKGRDLGFPTANLALSDPHKLWPPGGVYAVEVERGGRMHKGMMNVGRAPTLKDLAGDAKEVEVHIFGVDENLYGEWLRVYCHAYLREEQRFPSVEALRKQLLADKAQALDLLD